jgi:hypothetical protein
MSGFCGVAVFQDEEFQLCPVNVTEIFDSLEQFFHDFLGVMAFKILITKWRSQKPL